MIAPELSDDESESSDVAAVCRRHYLFVEEYFSIVICHVVATLGTASSLN
ncbi:MAG: hypothetical protein ABI280_05370 [Ginsengibacter sp.]